MPCIPSARDITSLYLVGIATIDTHRILKKKKRQGYLTQNGHTKPLSESSSRTSERLMIEGCGQIHTACYSHPTLDDELPSLA